MNGEVPSVPITTLAGIASLVDLLPEMPLPSPLPQTLCNKSLLFHPRVAEEAERLLSTHDDVLVPQLIQSLTQTSSEHIELKDHLTGESCIDQHHGNPVLLGSLLQRNPEVFKAKGSTPRQPIWNQQMPSNYNIPNCVQGPLSASSSGGFPQNHPSAGPPSMGGSHYHFASNSSPSGSSSHYTPPQGSPAVIPYANMPNMDMQDRSYNQQQPPMAMAQMQFTQKCEKYVNNGCGPQQNVFVGQMLNIVQPIEQQVSLNNMVSVISSATPERVQSEHMGLKGGVKQAQSIERASVITEPFIPTSSYSGVSDFNPMQEIQHVEPHQEVVTNHVMGPFDIPPVKTDPYYNPTQNTTPNQTVPSCEGFMQQTTTVTTMPHISEQFLNHETGYILFNPSDSSTSLPLPVDENIRTEQTVPSTDFFQMKQQLPKTIPTTDVQMKEPIVRLNKLTMADQAMMQKSLKAFAEQSPNKANKLGITSNNRITREKPKYREMTDSESESDEPKNKSKIFKSKGKERELQRKKDKGERKRAIDDDYVPNEADLMSAPAERSGVRKRSSSQRVDLDDNISDECMLPKKKVRKIERKLIPVLEKLSAEELMETNTYQRFNRAIEVIFDNTEDLDLSVELDDDGEVPPEALIPKYQLQDLCSEAAKLKSRRAMESIPTERLVRLLNILEKNIRDGAKVSPIADPDDDEDESKLWLELAMERVMRAVDASLTALYILTSPNMPKRIYLEDVIDRVVLFAKYQLQNTIYPSFDPVYRVNNKKENYQGNSRKKRAHAKEVREKSILSVYNKLHELVGLLAELMNIQVLTDTAVLHASTLGVSPFFVENISELQLSSLKLVTAIFTKYDKHRRLLLDDILASIARLPSSKRSIRTFRLNSDVNIQMLTALVLQLIQCVVCLPKNLKFNRKDNTQVNDTNIKTKHAMDHDVFVVNKYDTAMRTAGNFLTVFLNKCGSKNEEIDYRPLFENFIQDLLTTVNKPEWPAAELLLSLLGNLLVQNFSNKNVDMPLRVASIDYLGVVAARLRKDAVMSRLKIDRIDQLIDEIKQEEIKYAEERGAPPAKNITVDDKEEQRSLFLQKVLLDYLSVTAETDSSLLYTRHFYIAQWFKDAASEISARFQSPKESSSKSKKKKRKKRKKDESSEEESSAADSDEDKESKLIEDSQHSAEIRHLVENRKQFLIGKIRPFEDPVLSGAKAQVLQTYIDYDSADLISKFLASRRPFSKSFDAYLKQILRVLTESSIAIRTKAMKCLTMVVDADPSVLGRSDMQLGVHHSFLDHSTSVREAAVDLVGKFVLSRPELIEKYYDMLLARILDTGVSVRKRVIKILKDICIDYPEYPKIPEICVKMIRRVNDEEGIRKLVMEVFQNMWFTPVRERPQLDTTALIRKVMNITDVVAACRDTGLDWFEQLLVSLFKPKEDKDDSTKVHTEPPVVLITACRQIVNCLVEHILRLEEGSINKEGDSPTKEEASSTKDDVSPTKEDVSPTKEDVSPTKEDVSPTKEDVNISKEDGNVSGASSKDDNVNTELANKDESSKDNDKEEAKGTSQRLVACLTTLFLFAKIRPQLLVNHATTLQPYLSLKCQTKGDYQIISNVARTLELVVPLIEHPSETFLAQLEEDSVKLILQHDKAVVSSCLSCLGSVVNNVTQNYGLVRDCFRKYYGYLAEYKKVYELTPEDPRLEKCKPILRRALFTVGLLLRHFDFTQENVRQELAEDVVTEVFETLMFFMHNLNEDMQYFTLQSIGSLCIRYYNYMLENDLKVLYIHFLTDDLAPMQLRTQVLNNIETYLEEEELRMIKQDQEWAKRSKEENLKEMGDVSSGMASTIVQLYLKEVLESFLHPHVSIRHAAFKVIQLILQQGLVHPVQIVPYLLCMSTDVEQIVSHSADKQLQDIEKKYPGFIHMKVLSGIKLSYKLQHIVEGTDVVRGYRVKEGEPPGALNGFLYSLLRNTKQQRRAIALSLLKQFDEQAKTTLSEMLYVVDNLAYFPYQVQDEPLFIIHHIDIIISVTGSNLLQNFKEALIPQVTTTAVCNGPESEEKIVEANQVQLLDEDDEDEDVDSLLKKLPVNSQVIEECIIASQGCQLLLLLKQHLKDMCGISDTKICQYSPSESAKIYEKSVSRKNNVKFDPKCTLATLSEGPPSCDTEESKRALVEQYLGFRQLMLQIDPEDEDEEGGDGEKPAPTSTQQQLPPISISVVNVGGQQQHQISSHTVPPLILKVDDPGGHKAKDEQKDSSTTPKVPKLTILPIRHHDVKESRHSHRTSKVHKSDKSRKHKHKPKKRKVYSDEDSEDDYSDPDFLI